MGVHCIHGRQIIVSIRRAKCHDHQLLHQLESSSLTFQSGIAAHQLSELHELHRLILPYKLDAYQIRSGLCNTVSLPCSLNTSLCAH